MNIKESLNNIKNFGIPEDEDISQKPMDTKQTKPKRVDINILRSKLENQQSKEFRKNLTIFIFCILILGTIGVYLSL